MERAAPPRRRLPSIGDAVSFIAAVLGFVLLVATARHLFWGDASVEVAPIARVAPAAAPAASKRVAPKRVAPKSPALRDRARAGAAQQGHSGAAPHPLAARAALREGHVRATVRSEMRAAPTAHPVAQPGPIHAARQRPQPKASPRARTAFVATRAQRRARARQAAIIEPPLGFQTHVTLVELPAALGLDLGRDPIPALRIGPAHRH